MGHLSKTSRRRASRVLKVILAALLFFGDATHASISLDNSASSTGFGTSISYNLTVSQGNYLVVCLMYNGTSATWTNVKYNGVAMTQLIEENDAGGVTDVALYGLANPAAGTNAVTATLSSSEGWTSQGYSLSGVLAQELVAGNINGSGSGTVTITTTTVNNGDWMVDCLGVGNQNATTAGGSQANSLGGSTGFGSAGWSSTLGPVNAGSNSMTWTQSSFSQPAYALVALTSMTVVGASNPLGMGSEAGN